MCARVATSKSVAILELARNSAKELGVIVG